MSRGILFTALFLCVVSVFGADIYIAPSATGDGSGDDADNCTTTADMNPGFQPPGAGDTVYFRTGTYYFNSTIWLQGTGSGAGDLTYTAYAEDTNGTPGIQDDEYEIVTFNGSGIPDSGYAGFFWIPGRTNIVLSHINFANVRAGTTSRIAGVLIEPGASGAATDILIDGCSFTNFASAGIWVNGNDTYRISNITVRNCLFVNTMDTPNTSGLFGTIQIGKCDNFTVEKCTIRDGGVGGEGDAGERYYGGHGIYASNCTGGNISGNIITELANGQDDKYSYTAIVAANSDVPTIANNLIYNDPDSSNINRGIDYSGDNSSPVTVNVFNNTVYGTENVNNCIILAGDDTFVVTNNLCYANVADVINGGSSTTNILGGADPFVDSANLDLRPAYLGAAYNTGTTLGSITEDVYGNERPWYGAYDVGAAEYIPTITFDLLTQPHPITAYIVTGDDLTVDVDIIPPPATSTVLWEVLTVGYLDSTSDNAVITDTGAEQAVVNFTDGGVSFDTPEIYYLKVSVSDGAVSNPVTDIVKVEVFNEDVVDVNLTASPAFVRLPATDITFTWSFDNAPGNTQTPTWVVLDGDSVDVTSSLVFTSSGTSPTTITFSNVGQYTVTLQGNDPADSASIVVNVYPEPKGSTASGGCSASPAGTGSVAGFILMIGMALAAMRFRKQ